jgi:hypothetical protein
MSFFFGAVCGFAIAVLWGLYLVAKPKADANPATPTFSAIGHDLSGKSATMDAAHARMLKNVLRSASDGKLWEIPTTRH